MDILAISLLLFETKYYKVWWTETWYGDNVGTLAIINYLLPLSCSSNYTSMVKSNIRCNSE